MGCKLQIEETYKGYSIGWTDGTDFGLMIGQDHGLDTCDHDTVAIQNALLDAGMVEGNRETGNIWVWDTLTAAKKALRLAKATFKAQMDARKNAPWPEWAVTAIANGWKAPRGWKPCKD